MIYWFLVTSQVVVPLFNLVFCMLVLINAGYTKWNANQSNISSESQDSNVIGLEYQKVSCSITFSYIFRLSKEMDDVGTRH